MILPLIAGAAFLFAALAPGAKAAEEPLPKSSQSIPTSADSRAAQPEAVLYYFHRTLRCQSCLAVETYIDEALRIYFSDALKDGRLLWRPTNVEEPQNLHFAEDFSLEFNSAVLVKFDGEESHSWANLEKVWDLWENKEAVVDYIQESVGAVLALESAKQAAPEPN